MMASAYHEPVLLNEVITGLRINPSGIYVDATFGGGGHSRAILEKLNDDGRLIVFDQDENAWQNKIDDKRVQLVPQNFRHLQRFLRLYNALPIDGLLADLGVSSFQIDTPERGFSTRFEGKLDMRMDMRNELTAEKILQTYSEARLHKLFEQYGEVSNSRTLAKTIVQARKINAIKTISGFRQILQPIIKGNPNRYLAQVFQALRIEVNDELGALQDLLEQSLAILRPGGRLVVISFHSSEDRIVKNFVKQGNIREEEKEKIYSLTTRVLPFRLITKKPITASENEVKKNPRSASAKLRIAEKV